MNDSKSMIVNQSEFNFRDDFYLIRSSVHTDAINLSKVRWQIDGGTQNLDREQGKAFIDEQ